MRSSDRRISILDAAQQLFLQEGYAATSIADIRAACGASVGSIYHAFASKEAIAIALVERAIAGWTAATTNGDCAGTAKDLIQTTVEGLLRWSAAHPMEFRILDELRTVATRISVDGALAELMRASRRESSDRLAEYVAEGAIRNLPVDLLQALVLGPSYEFLRACGGEPPSDKLDEVIAVFSEAAWRGVAA